MTKGGGGSAGNGSAARGTPPGSRRRAPWLARLARRVLLGFVLVGVGIALMQVSRIAGIVVVVIGLLSIGLLPSRDPR